MYYFIEPDYQLELCHTHSPVQNLNHMIHRLDATTSIKAKVNSSI